MIQLTGKKLRSLQPTKKAHDPYLMALLIALAQAQRLGRKEQMGKAGGGPEDHVAQPNPTPSFQVRLVRIILYFETETRLLRLYLFFLP